MLNNSIKKRVYTRVGDIFCIELDDYKMYFQFIAVDYSYLGADTIRVFKTRYPIGHVPTLENLVKDEVMFYAHTMIKPGLKMNTWTKVGNHREVGMLDEIYFRTTSSWSPQELKSYDWYIHRINADKVPIGELTEEWIIKSDLGFVMNPNSIVEKICLGEYQGVLPY